MAGTHTRPLGIGANIQAAIQVVVCQPLIVPGRVADNVEAIRLIAVEAKQQGARLAVFGGCSLTGYDFKGFGVGSALAVDDPRIVRLHRQARNVGMGLVIWLFERDGGRLYTLRSRCSPTGGASCNARSA